MLTQADKKAVVVVGSWWWVAARRELSNSGEGADRGMHMVGSGYSPDCRVQSADCIKFSPKQLSAVKHELPDIPMSSVHFLIPHVLGFQGVGPAPFFLHLPAPAPAPAPGRRPSPTSASAEKLPKFYDSRSWPRKSNHEQHTPCLPVLAQIQGPNFAPAISPHFPNLSRPIAIVEPH